MKPSYSNIKTIEGEIMNIVMVRISSRRLQRARMAAAFHGTLVFATIIGFVPAFQYTVSQGAQSGFFEYFSLLASDGLNLAGSWQSFVLSLAQSAPIVGAIISLGIIAVFAYATRKIWSDVASFRNRDVRPYQTVGLA